MKKMKIGSKLRTYRLNYGWTVEYTAKELLRRYDYDVSCKTIYGWENDLSLPRTQAFLYLCELYHMERPYEEFPISPQPKAFSITPKERWIIQELRKHPELYNRILRVLDF